ncbi:MAG: ATP-dependent chaperone ClpB, partial [Proteobacteria bacterium]|nr:ATP-dependent chaperone ClpB [Pseudomonadota bacterium]
MDLDKYTERSRGFIQAAQGLALRASHQQITPEHLLKVLLDDEEGLAANLIQAAGGDPARALEGAEAALAKLPKVEGSGAGQAYLGGDLARVFERAEKLAEQAGDSFVTAERLLLALAMASGAPAAEALSAARVSPHSLNAAVEHLRKGRKAD